MMGLDWRYVTATGTVTQGEGLFYGVQFRVGTTNDGVTIYDGLDTTDGKLIFTAGGSKADPNMITLPKPIRFETGLHIVFNGNVDNASLFFEPIRGGH